MFNIRFMYPLVFWVGMPLLLVVFAAAAYYNTRLLEGLRRYYAPTGMFLLELTSPRNFRQVISVWADWTIALGFFIVAAAMPNGSFAPDLVRKGAVYVEFVVQVNNAMNDESDRKYHPDGDPGTMYQWGTRLDQVVRFIDNDFLPQLKGNKTGITTVEGKGFNFWDLDDDNEDPTAGFRVMLDNFLKVGAASDPGANYASGFQTALAEFDKIRELDIQHGDTVDKEYFIVLFADGNFSGDQTELTKMLAELAKRQVRLLIVGMGEPQLVDVPKYDVTTHQRSGTYTGQTVYKPKTLEDMQKAVPNADFIYAPPGTEHINYNFPSKAGGLYAVPHNSNLYPLFLGLGLIMLLKVTIFGGMLPRWRFVGAAFEPLRRARRYLIGRLPGQSQTN